jgi:hypothetical protein
MPTAFYTRSEVLRIAMTLAIGAVGGLLFQWIQFPGGYISGAMTTVAIAAISGQPVMLPRPVAYIFMMTLGISLGSLVSAQFLSSLGAYPFSLAMLGAATVCTVFGSAWYLERVHGWDRTTSFLSANPGALSQTIALGLEKGADVPAIAVAQTMRVVLLTAFLPLLISYSGVTSAVSGTVLTHEVSTLSLLVLALAAMGMALVLRWLNFPAAWMFGAMLSSGLLHGFGLVDGGIPNWARAVALIGIGTLIGASFARVSARVLVSHLGAALGSFVVALAICAVFVVILVLTTHVQIANTVIAFSPGAMDAMFGLALTLHIDPIFVGVHHLSRFFFASLLTPGIVHLFNRPQATADADD